MASLFLDFGIHQKVISITEEALDVLESPSIKESQKAFSSQIFWLHLGIAYEEMKKYEDAITFYSKILDSNGPNIDEIRLKAISGGYNCAAKLKKESLRNQFFNLLHGYSEYESRPEIFGILGNHFYQESEYSKAVKYYKKAYKSCKEANNIILQVEYLKQLSQAYEKSGDYKSALLTTQKYQSIQDTLLSAQKDRNLRDMIAKYETREKELEIQSLKRQQESDRKIKLIGAFLLLALASTAFIMFRNYKLKRDSNRKMLLHVAEINEKNTQLEVKNSELQQFAHSVSHDLKLPVNAVRSYIQLAKRSIKAGSQKVIHHLDTALENSVNLSLLLEGLLAYTRVGKSHTDHEFINLNKVVKKVFNSLREDPKYDELFYAVDELPVIWGLYSDIYMLFQNLIQNALKFTPAERTPEINIRYEYNNSFHFISISDNGMGIKPQYQQAIFGLFQRVSQESEGTGIGLALVKKVMDYQGGRVTVESTLNVGSTFTLQFPK
ncbi:MAG: ATP-binding protein [Bacteroidia bacterium]|nr:ATP-binding protein [Bacteroidia bacterium]